MEIHQASFYADYIRRLGWVVERIGTTYVYIKPFPIIGGIMKIQRFMTLPDPEKTTRLIAQYRIRNLAAEPDGNISRADYDQWCSIMKTRVRLNTDAFLPTKTIRIDLKPHEQTIFSRFSEAKRRGVRRAVKHGIAISVTDDIRTFLSVKNSSAGFLGWITTHGQDKLWESAAPDHADILIARTPSGTPVGSVLLLYFRKLAYYWVAGATKEGKSLFAPTLLVWEAVKQAKRRDMLSFDFTGVWDERLPDRNHEWKGFTRFKEGFGGDVLYYPALQNSLYSQSAHNG